MTKVFISYSSADKPFVRRLEKSLQLAGVDVWLDEKKLLVGDSIITHLGMAIDSADFVVAVLSKTSVRSTWVETELSLAMTLEQERNTKVVLPIKIDDCYVPAFLRAKLYADFSESSNFDDSLYQLLAAVSPNDAKCSYCYNNVSLSLNLCPHCAHPTAPPNVRSARSKEEQKALRDKYISALELARSRDCEDLFRRFEASVASSRVVINTGIEEFDRLATSDRELYRRYYRPAGRAHESARDRLSQLAEEVLFPGYGARIRYGVLSLDGDGLYKYGICSLIMRDEMISHRTSFFEGNSSVFLRRHDYNLQAGSKATWQDRSKLCVIKLASRLVSERPSTSDFADWLLGEGENPGEDDFIEAHIWGPVSVRTVERVKILAKGARARSVRTLEERLAKYEIRVDVA